MLLLVKFDFRNIALISILLSLCLCASAEREQISIRKIDSMPDLPQPYAMRDWDKVARDFDAFLFDPRKKGPHLPLIKFADKPGATDKEIFLVPSYVGMQRDGTESITCLGAVGGALVAGIDKTNQGGRNYIEIAGNYFHEKPGLYLNNLAPRTGKSFWYEIFPSVLFYRIFSFAPESDRMRKQFYTTADNWYDACAVMGGRTSPWKVPNFDHTAFSFEKMKPVDNKRWKEADVSAAIAWIEYTAYRKSGKKKYLDGAKWAMDYLQQSKQNPFYEVLMPLGAYTAARMNAELGTNYDTRRFVNWSFAGDNRRRWGVTTGRWGDYDCAGLVGSVRRSTNMYAFAMNSFDLPGAIVPIVRYDDRFADAIGKWMLNLANSARLFYSNSLPKARQSDCDWSRKYDSQSCIAYEGLRQKYVKIDRVKRDHDDIWVVSKSSKTPFATGDARRSGWGKTNLGLYGSGYVGILAGIINKTNIEGILQLDCLATDFHRAPAYPTYLYYNPYKTEKKVEIDLGKTPRDLYLSIDNRFAARNVSGKTNVTLKPKSSSVIVVCPGNSKLTRSGRKTFANGIAVDYR